MHTALTHTRLALLTCATASALFHLRVLRKRQVSGVANFPLAPKLLFCGLAPPVVPRSLAAVLRFATVDAHESLDGALVDVLFELLLLEFHTEFEILTMVSVV